jgi:hypothetical protein
MRIAALAMLVGGLACPLAHSSGVESVIFGSPSTLVLDAGVVHRNQFLFETGGAAEIRPALPDQLPRNSPPNGYKRLDNGHQLLTFASIVEYPGAGVVFAGEVIEVDADWTYVRRRLSAAEYPELKSINVNAVTVDPAEPDWLLFSIAHSAYIAGSAPFNRYYPGDVIRYEGDRFVVVLRNPAMRGRNINALDVRDVGGVRYEVVSFESGAAFSGLAGNLQYGRSDIVARGSANQWLLIDRTSVRHPALAGLGINALDMVLGPVPDALFIDRFEADD